MINGKWIVETISGVAGGKDRIATVNVRIKCLSDTCEEIRTLISAAPELLEACKTAECWLSAWRTHIIENGPPPPGDYTPITLLRDAIAKAEGR